ncbi:MAG: hypothetical protein QY309_04825 [Cyclobacteriaceae bacterium]|nr:MAG: hypothetical protein QY309_04825 [Cyclobacteriaceae bacterium]
MNFEEKLSILGFTVIGINTIADLNQILEAILLTGSIIAGGAGMYWRYLKHKRENK